MPRYLGVGVWTVAALFGSGWMSAASAQTVAADSTQPTAASASTSQPRGGEDHAHGWTLAVRGGITMSNNPQSGSSQLPAQLASVLSGLSGVAPPRAVSSWMFGDGVTQLNGATEPFGVPRMAGLDTMLTSPGVSYGPSGQIGATLSRTLGSRWSVNVGVDVDLRANALSANANTTIDETRSDFVTVWQTFLQRIDASVGPTVAATRTGTTSSGRQIDTTATLTYWLGAASQPTRPFVEFGGGASTTTGQALGAVLTGDWQASFTLPSLPPAVQGGTSPFHETDTVSIHVTDSGTRFMGIVGAGLERALTRRSGLRFSVRVLIGPSRNTTTMDVTPVSQTLTPPGLFGIVTPGGSVVWSNSPTLPNSLSGPALTAFKTFASSGSRLETAFTLAYLIRF